MIRSSDMDWHLDTRKPQALANARVVLAMLRMYRGVSISSEEGDPVGLGRCLWPVVRLFPEALRAGLRRIPQNRTGRMLGARFGQQAQDWDEETRKLLHVSDRPLQRNAPDDLVLQALGEALAFRTPSFKPLYDAVEGRLQELAAMPIPADVTLAILAEVLQFDPNEVALLRLGVAVAVSSIGGSPLALFRHPVRIHRALQAAIGLASDHAVRTMLRRSSRLVRSGLLDHAAFVHGGDMADHLQLSQQALLIITSRARTLPAIAALVLKPGPSYSAEALSWPHLQARTKMLEAVLTGALREGSVGVNILLHGESGTGKTQYAARLAQTLGRAAFSIADCDANGDPARRADRLANLTLTQLFAPAGRSVIVLDEAEDIFQHEYNNPMARMFGAREDGKAWMNRLLEDNRHPVIWISNRISQLDPAYLRRFTYCLEFPQTPRKVRRVMAQRHLEPVGCSDALIDGMAAEPDVSPALLASAARFVRLAGVAGESPDDTVRLMMGDMVNALGGKWAGRLPEPATRFDLRYLHVSDGVQPQAVLDGLARLQRGRLLLSGPPGTGKTQFAAEISQRLGRELVYRTASDINSPWFGESERNVARLFRECDPAADVLFVDEADALLGSREAGPQRAELAVVTEFLRQIEGFTGVLVCATNNVEKLDAALLRRFEFRLEMLPLSPAQRNALFMEVAADRTGPINLAQMDPQLIVRLGRLHLLTPGDFGNVRRRSQALGLQMTAADWVSELESEHRVKPDSHRRSIGFV